MEDKAANPGEEFFMTGLEKYLDAKSAVKMFEEEVQRRVKKVVTRHQRDLQKLFGQDWSLRDYFGSETDCMWLGQKVVFKGSGVLYFYLSFRRAEENRSCFIPSVTFERERGTVLNPLWTSLEAIRPPKLSVGNLEFSFDGGPHCDDWTSCEESLDAVIRDWIGLWDKLGGLPKYLTRQDPQA